MIHARLNNETVSAKVATETIHAVSEVETVSVDIKNDAPIVVVATETIHARVSGITGEAGADGGETSETIAACTATGLIAPFTYSEEITV